MDAMPKRIQNKIRRMNSLIDDANRMRVEIEKWCEENGIDTCSEEWAETVYDDCTWVKGILIEGVLEMLENAN